MSGKSSGGRATRSMKDFDCFIRETCLRDVALNNVSFMWSNLRERLVRCRLDIFLFSSEREVFSLCVRQEALVRVIFFYHCPILLVLNHGGMSLDV